MDDLQYIEPWLVLQRIPALGNVRFNQLLDKYPDPSFLLGSEVDDQQLVPEPLCEVFQQLRSKGDSHPIYQQVKMDLDYIEQNNIHVITKNSDLYPPLLKEVYSPPPILYVRGDPYALSSQQLGVVGARKSSTSAQEVALSWSETLSNAGVCVTSGLAVGIDAAAHRGALQGSGATIAVLAHGIDQLYPRRHCSLAEEVVARGALVTEFPLGVAPKKDHFPRRNRIISGLSDGVLVVEAALRSGSLTTARHAIEQNRDVYALPGSIHNVMAKGCHHLIKQGAFLVESPQDILELMGLNIRIGPNKPAEKSVLSATARKILESIDYAPTHFDAVQNNVEIDIAELMVELIMLETEGYIEGIAGNYQRIK